MCSILFFIILSTTHTWIRTICEQRFEKQTCLLMTTKSRAFTAPCKFFFVVVMFCVHILTNLVGTIHLFIVSAKGWFAWKIIWFFYHSSYIYFEMFQEAAFSYSSHDLIHNSTFPLIGLFYFIWTHWDKCLWMLISFQYDDLLW